MALGTVTPFMALDLGFRGAIVAMLCLLAAVIWRDRAKSDAIWIGLALCLGMIIYAIESAPHFRHLAPRNLELPLVAIANGNNLLFWLLALALCSDHFKLKVWHALSWLTIVGFALATLMTYDLSTTGTDHPWHSLHIALGLLPIFFSAMAIATALRSWPADLVERRRWLRGFIVVAGTLYMLGTGLARLSSGSGYFEAAPSLLDMLALGAVVFVIAWRLLILEGGDLFENSSTPLLVQPMPTPTPMLTGAGSTAHPSSEAIALRSALEHAMLVDHVYRQENLTIANLARRLGVQEYRLRRLINQGLGHRNFNAFLNLHRLEDVRCALMDGQRQHLPILTLALEAGFQSIGPFNRAFKAHYKLTPSEFREKYKAESEKD